MELHGGEEDEEEGSHEASSQRGAVLHHCVWCVRVCSQATDIMNVSG